jgi:hypothetical protein
LERGSRGFLSFPFEKGEGEFTFPFEKGEREFTSPFEKGGSRGICLKKSPLTLFLKEGDQTLTINVGLRFANPTYAILQM